MGGEFARSVLDHAFALLRAIDGVLDSAEVGATREQRRGW